jgi:hypothetical protein
MLLREGVIGYESRAVSASKAGLNSKNIPVDSKNHPNSPGGASYHPGAMPKGLTLVLLLYGIWTFFAPGLRAQTAADVVLAWDPSTATDVTGYNVYYGGVSHTYTNSVSVGNVTNTTLSRLVVGATYYFAVSALDSQGLESSLSNEISFTPSSNTNPPSISAIPSQTISINTVCGPLAFTIGTQSGSVANVTISANSSNPTLVPNANIALGGTGTNRTVTVTPAQSQSGSATIAVTVCDGALCSTTSFLLTVNALQPTTAPTIALVSPSTGATYAAPANISLTANVGSNGHSITKVQFYNGAALLGEDSAAPYTFNWNSVGAGSYAVMAKLVYDTGSIISSLPVNVTVSGLPAPWQTMDIGSVGLTGSASITGNLYTVQGAGNIGGSGDSFRFLYQPLTGDGEIRAQVTSVQNIGNGGCIGTMIRESLTSGSKYALMGMTPNGGLRWQRRSGASNGTSSSKAGSGSPPNVWVRVVRTSNTLSGYKSTDGVNWSLVNSGSISMATNIYVGIAVASGSTSSLNTSLFTNVVVVP